MIKRSMKGHCHLLGVRRFMPLFVTQFCGAFNDNAFKNALLIWLTYTMAAHTDTDPAMMITLAAGLFILPFFLFSALAGQVVDKFERSKLTRLIKQIEVLLMLAVSVCFLLKSIGGLFALLFLMGVHSTFFGPIKYSLLPTHLHHDELIAGNGLIEGGTFLAILLGTLLGGLLILLPYGVVCMAVCLVGMALIGWWASCAIPIAAPSYPALAIDWHLFRSTWRMMGYARVEPTVWLAIIGISWFWVVGATFLTQFPLYTQSVLHAGASVVTLFLMLFSLGIGLGSLGCNYLLKGQINGRLVPYGAMGMTGAIFLFYLATWYYSMHVPAAVSATHLLTMYEFLTMGLSSGLILLSLLLLSVCGGIYIVPLYAIMQHRSNAQYLARIIAANNVVNALFMVTANIITLGAFAIHVAVMHVLLILGVINIPIYFIIRGIVRRRLQHG